EEEMGAQLRRRGEDEVAEAAVRAVELRHYRPDQRERGGDLEAREDERQRARKLNLEQDFRARSVDRAHELEDPAVRGLEPARGVGDAREERDDRADHDLAHDPAAETDGWQGGDVRD